MRTNNATKYDVGLTPAAASPLYWEARKVYHVPPGENGHNHHVYINVYDIDGKPLRGDPNVEILWGWSGQKPDEVVEPKQLEKLSPEHMTNIPINWGQKVWCQVQSTGNVPSDVVLNMHTAHPDESNDVRTGHHSFVVEFQLVKAAVQPPIINPAFPVANMSAIQAGLQDLRIQLDKVIALVG